MRPGSPERYFTLNQTHLGEIEANIREKARRTVGKRTRGCFQPDVFRYQPKFLLNIISTQIIRIIITGNISKL